MRIFGKQHKTELNTSRMIVLAPEISMEFMRVPAGKFLMGAKKSDKWSEPRERPQHKVYLDEYFIGRFPVTNKQYRAYIAETGAEPPKYLKEGRIPSTAENHPVIFCNWLNAVGFCDWARIKTGLNIRLPSEAEWEKAARGTDGRFYPWGNHYDWEKGDRQIMNASWNQRKGALATNEVGRSPDKASPYGCENMAGSVVEEWVNDWLDNKYYLTSPDRNPIGPSTGIYRVLRNGISRGGRLMRSANRFGDLPDSHLYGFRCAFSLQ